MPPRRGRCLSPRSPDLSAPTSPPTSPTISQSPLEEPLPSSESNPPPPQPNHSPPQPSPPLPPLPDSPHPWRWCCHLCNTVYDLSVTRRCLHDGHLFCSAVPDASSTQRAQSSSKENEKKKKKKQRRPGPCVSQFDYHGWADYGRWRREVAARAEQRGKKELEGKAGERDCWNNCDSPSECHHPPIDKEMYVWVEYNEEDEKEDKEEDEDEDEHEDDDDDDDDGDYEDDDEDDDDDDEDGDSDSDSDAYFLLGVDDEDTDDDETHDEKYMFPIAAYYFFMKIYSPRGNYSLL